MASSSLTERSAQSLLYFIRTHKHLQEYFFCCYDGENILKPVFLDEVEPGPVELISHAEVKHRVRA